MFVTEKSYLHSLLVILVTLRRRLLQVFLFVSMLLRVWKKMANFLSISQPRLSTSSARNSALPILSPKWIWYFHIHTYNLQKVAIPDFSAGAMEVVTV